MSQVKVKENESLDSALRRFKRQTSRDGVIQEVRKREHYEKPKMCIRDRICGISGNTCLKGA